MTLQCTVLHCKILTLPVGLCGVFTKTNLVFSVKAALSWSSGMDQLGGCSCTGTSFAPTCTTTGEGGGGVDARELESQHVWHTCAHARELQLQLYWNKLGTDLHYNGIDKKGGGVGWEGVANCKRLPTHARVCVHQGA